MLSMSFEFRVALVLAFVVYAIGVLALTGTVLQFIFSRRRKDDELRRASEALESSISEER